MTARPVPLPCGPTPDPARVAGAPVWLLDVDGVINAATLKPDPNVWPCDQWARAKVAGLKILVSLPVLAFIRATHESGAAEIRWLTTWMNDAQAIADEFGLPRFPVEGGPEYDRRLHDRVFDREAWWKLPAAKRVLTDEKRPLIWTDDDITYDLGRRGQDEMRTLGPALLLGPNERTGLTPKHLRRIGEFLDLYPAAAHGDPARTALRPADAEAHSPEETR